jgi:hypothetical protein
VSRTVVFTVTSQFTARGCTDGRFRVWVPNIRPGTLTCGFVSVVVGPVRVAGLRDLLKSGAVPLSVRHPEGRQTPSALSWCLRTSTTRSETEAADLFAAWRHRCHGSPRSRQRCRPEVDSVRSRSFPKPLAPTGASAKPQISTHGRIFGTHRLVVVAGVVALAEEDGEQGPDDPAEPADIRGYMSR